MGGSQISVFVVKTGKTIVVEVKASDSIFTVKAKLHEKEGLPPADQQLFFAGKQLEDCRLLGDLDIKGDARLSLEICTWQIFVKTLTGKTIALDVTPDDSIDNVKAKIQNEEGIPHPLRLQHPEGVDTAPLSSHSRRHGRGGLIVILILCRLVLILNTKILSLFLVLVLVLVFCEVSTRGSRSAPPGSWPISTMVAPSRYGQHVRYPN